VKIRRFVAVDMRTALTQIKEELGPEAVIMSNKKIPEGVELMAAIDYSQSPSASQSMAEQPQQNNQPNVQNQIPEDVVSVSSQHIHAPTQEESVAPDSLQALLNRKVQHSAQPVQSTKIKPVSTTPGPDYSIEEQFKSFTERLVQSTQEPDGTSELNIDAHGKAEHIQQTQRAQEDTLSTKPQTVDMNDFNKMKEEMASIRQLLEHQVSGLMWQDMAQRDPSRALLTNKLMGLGISEQIADQIAGYIPSQASENQAMKHALSLLSQQLNTTQNDIIKRGGVISIVGPTGVGKTTTVAKLAAKFAQLHGAEQVALISTDTYRIGGFQQLETYGKIIGCQVKLAKDAQGLDQLLAQMATKKLILIDTAGMGQRDMRLAEHLSSLVNSSRVRIRNYLVLAANTQASVMQENVERFKKIPLCGCIYTKLDESLSVGEIISTSIQNGLPIGYLTDGQRVPEDIKVANAEKLVSLAEKMASKSIIKNSMSSRMVLKSASAVS
jgi:flagellar biosynthesis protein FlhF